jgi:hypothetical protein
MRLKITPKALYHDRKIKSRGNMVIRRKQGAYHVGYSDRGERLIVDVGGVNSF